MTDPEAIWEALPAATPRRWQVGPLLQGAVATSNSPAGTPCGVGPAAGPGRRYLRVGCSPYARALRVALAVLFCALLAGAAQAPTLAGELLVTLRVTGSPFSPDGDGHRERLTVTATLARDAHLSIRVLSFGGRAVRTLVDTKVPAGTHTRRWDGRDDSGQRVPNGAYRVVATADDGAGEARAARLVTKARSVAYPPAPGLITVAIDAGHGGDWPGAVGSEGTREADINLDIALRLKAMLQGARVRVVITRTSDSNVNKPPIDRTGDGEAGYYDELAARRDLFNPARADLLISVHNNAASDPRVGGPATLYSDGRTFSGRSLRLARLVQDEVVAKLRRFRTSTWSPYDHGVIAYDYWILRAYDPPNATRPSLMPGVLAEGLFMTHPYELRLLKRPRVRAALAEAHYEAIARYLAVRGGHAGYRLVEGPQSAPAGAALHYEVVVRNQGTTVLDGRMLRVGLITAPFLYDGRARAGTRLGTAQIPRLEPGEQAQVSLDVVAPGEPGEWLVLFEAMNKRGVRMSRSGSPALQVPLMTLAP